MARVEIEELLNLVPQLYRLIGCSVMGTEGLDLFSMSQYQALSYIKRNPGTTLSEVARDLDIALGSASDLIERLVVANLVERRTNPSDRRQVQISITDFALETFKGMRAERQRQLLLVKETMTETEWDAFAEGLVKWVAVLDKTTIKRREANPVQRGNTRES